MIYSVFISKHYNNKNELTYDYQFWMNDLSDIVSGSDWRFCEVAGKRKQAIFLGLINDPQFPIKYPLTLLNGTILTSCKEAEQPESHHKILRVKTTGQLWKSFNEKKL